MRRRKAHKPSPSSTPADTNNQITYNPAYATSEGTYSEINDNAVGIAGHPGQRLDRENYVACNSASTDYVNATVGDETYAISIPHPYDKVVEMSSRRNTSSLT